MAKVNKNHSQQYSMMLLAQAFMKLLCQWNSGRLPELSEDLVHNRISAVLTRILIQTLQSEDSWLQKSLEETTYGILTLTSASSIPWAGCISEYMHSAIKRAKAALSKDRGRWLLPNRIWVEKVTYSSPILSEAYCLAAMYAQPSTWRWSPAAQTVGDIEPKVIQKLAGFFNRIPLICTPG